MTGGDARDGDAKGGRRRAGFLLGDGLVISWLFLGGESAE